MLDGSKLQQNNHIHEDGNEVIYHIFLFFSIFNSFKDLNAHREVNDMARSGSNDQRKVSNCTEIDAIC